MKDQRDDQREAEGSASGGERQIQFHLPADLEYVYRDIFNVYAGRGDVVIEMGNLHRSMVGHATISNRIVVSMSNAYVLVQTLQQALQAAQEQLQQQLQRQGR